MNIVLDTNTVLYFLAGRLVEPLPPANFYVSTISEIELLSYPLLSKQDESEIVAFLADITIVNLNSEIKKATIDLRRQYRLKLHDALIVATALCLKAKLLTNDIKLLNITEIPVQSLQIK